MEVSHLLLVPGLSSDARIWAPTIEALERSVACSVGDTLDHRDRTLGDMARRILVDAPPKFALAGVSMGGMVALEIVAQAPQRVTHLALFDTTARSDTTVQWVKRHLASRVVNTFGHFDRLAARNTSSLLHPSAPARLREELVEMTVEIGPKVFVRQNQALAARRDYRPSLTAVPVPTAVVVGADDRIAPPTLSSEIHTLIAGSTFDIVPNCGHLPPLEQPKATAAIIRRLLLVATGQSGVQRV